MVKISDSELEIMSIIWKKDIITSREIIECYNKKKKNESAIRTLIGRLLRKGAIFVERTERREHYYKANIDKKEYIRKITIDYVKKCMMIEGEDWFGEEN